VPKLKPCLWVNVPPAEVVAYYTAIFPDVVVGDVNPMMAHIVIADQPLMILGGNRDHAFNESFSFVIDCKDQAEVDHYWEKLTANGGAESQCAWCRDKYGLSWQVVPQALVRCMSDPDRTKADRAMQAMFRMKKIIVADIEAAFNGAA
jgi:predicted 3-demethylubiquinone-9 3-methyltransferase (glyoxalase superfamily)